MGCYTAREDFKGLKFIVPSFVLFSGNSILQFATVLQGMQGSLPAAALHGGVGGKLFLGFVWTAPLMSCAGAFACLAVGNCIGDIELRTLGPVTLPGRHSFRPPPRAADFVLDDERNDMQALDGSESWQRIVNRPYIPFQGPEHDLREDCDEESEEEGVASRLVRGRQIQPPFSGEFFYLTEMSQD